MNGINVHEISYRDILGVCASLVGIASFIIYLVEIFRSHTKPHLFSWILWGLSLAVLWLIQFLEKAGPGAWATMVTALFCLLIAVCAWSRGEKNITRSDWISFIIGLGSIFLWYLTKQPLLTVILLSVVDVAGFYPTIRKSFQKPWEEPMSMYIITIAKYIMALFAMENLVIVNWFYPACIMVSSGVTLGVLGVGRWKKRPV